MDDRPDRPPARATRFVAAARRWRPSRRWHPGRGSSGQSLVELALVLPILLALLLISIDFGRVYLGYINVQNMARIAANEAATNPDAWTNGDTAVIASYREQILQDASAINCQLPLSGGALDSSVDPVFSGTAVGDTASVRITCQFGVVTPLISSIVGNSVEVAGTATFPVRTGMVVNGGATGGGISEPTPDFFADDTTVTEGTEVQFHYTGGGGTPTAYLWEFGDGGTSTDPDPTHTYVTSDSYDVKLTVSNSAGSGEMLKGDYILVFPVSSIAFSGAPVSGVDPLVVQFTDESAGAPTAWAWEFGDSGTSTAKNPSHTYNSHGTFDVTLTITDAVGGTKTLTKTAYVTVSAGLCTVPNFTNVSSESAQGLWSAAGFTTGVQFQGGNRPWPIKSQTIVGNSKVPCDSTITVKKT
jgi:PKD repeat protein